MLKFSFLFFLYFWACLSCCRNQNGASMGQGRQLKQVIDECSGRGAAKCVDGCQYKYVQRVCQDDNIIQNVFGPASKFVSVVDYPFLISLQQIRRIEVTDEVVPGCYTHFCGGILILKDVVLTTTHFLEAGLLDNQKPIARFQKTVYATRTSKCRHSDGVENVLASEAMVHIGYDSITLDNDILLILIRGEMSDKYGFADFSNSKEFESQVKTFIFGYGDSVLESNDFESILPKLAPVATIDKEFCVSMLPQNSRAKDYLNYSNMICVQNNTADTCEGDSGGTLFVNEGKSVVILGIAFWDSGIQFESTLGLQPPSFFTWVNNYTEWILDWKQKYSLQEQEATALLDFKSGITDSSTNLSNWRGTNPCNNWVGISCTNQRITNISLGDALWNVVNGAYTYQFTSPIILLLLLFLLIQNVKTSIPSQWMVMDKLQRIQLGQVGLKGTLPTWLSVMKYLKVFYADDGNLHGTIPAAYSTWDVVIMDVDLVHRYPKLSFTIGFVEVLKFKLQPCTRLFPIEDQKNLKFQTQQLHNQLFFGITGFSFSTNS